MISTVISNIAYCTRCDGQTLRFKVDEVKKGFLFNAQDLTDALENDFLWKEAKADETFIIDSNDCPSPVKYKGKEYDFYDVWDEMEYCPYAFILVKRD